MGVSAGLYHYVTTKSEIPLTTLKLKANRVLNTAGGSIASLLLRA